MSEPLSYSAFIAALKGAGLRVVEVKTNGQSPAAHNRNAKGAWGPVNGVAVHHTVTKGTANTVEICRAGYAELPGPLCHGVIAKDGTVYVVGYGRTNHAGKGDPDVFNAVRAESYATNPPAPRQNTVDGNVHLYGFECENLGDGVDPWPAAQLDAIARAAAAICKAHGWTEKSVIGHKEWTNTKIDPRGFSMAGMRGRVKDRLAGKAPAPAPKPLTVEQRLAALEKRVTTLEKR